AKAPIHRYAFPAQDFGRPEETVYMRGVPDPTEIGTLVDIDLNRRTIDIKKRMAAARIHPARVFVHSWVRPKPIPEALFRLGEAVADGGTGAFLSARRVLLNEPPA